MRQGRIIILFLVAVLTTGTLRLSASASNPPTCDHDIGGINLPQGFCATVFADGLGVARHMAVDARGDLYVALQKSDQGGIVALKDSKGTGHADQVKYFGTAGGSGLALHGGYLYYATPTAVLRYPLNPDELVPSSGPQTVVGDFPEQDEHAAKSIAIDDQGHLYVNVGAPSNACQEEDRSPGSQGIKPCPLLAEHGGIWRFDADKTGQQFPEDGVHYAKGIRNAVAITWNGAAGSLYALQMGRDQLADNWPKYFTDAESAELPAEEFFKVEQGGDYGWPYCYYDQLQKKKVLAPEYGGDGKEQGDCGKYGQPIVEFPGHWSPESVLFYSGTAFPAKYRGGAFIAFHGSWNRAPLPQAGARVVYQPFNDGKPSGPYEVFADGFAGTDKLVSPGDANFRAMGLAESPDGALYIGDTQKGRIWRVTYIGQ